MSNSTSDVAPYRIIRGKNGQGWAYARGNEYPTECDADGNRFETYETADAAARLATTCRPSQPKSVAKRIAAQKGEPYPFADCAPVAAGLPAGSLAAQIESAAESWATVPDRYKGEPSKRDATEVRRKGTCVKIDVRERIERNIFKSPTGCWLWTGKKDASGYGRLTVSLGSRAARFYSSAHRYVYQNLVGFIPDGMNVLHSCDVRHCVNPDHLWLGTHTENMQDMIKKGRAGWQKSPKDA